MYLCRGNHWLGVVLFEERLDVEELHNGILANTKELAKLVIGVDDLAVRLVLEAVGLDILRDTAVDLRAGHEIAMLDTEECRQVLADLDGLGEAVGLSLASAGGLATATTALGELHLARHATRQLAETS